jgi:hypothetical protein
MTLVDKPFSTFTNAELVRLSAYKAAVAAGFYTDWDGSAETTDAHALAGLSTVSDEAEFPFTAEERARLEALRARVAAGNADTPDALS